ncbi:hypothetical protein [Runella salmonicolor]|nr:hypothetical protein [Runella salmonicolor]
MMIYHSVGKVQNLADVDVYNTTLTIRFGTTTTFLGALPSSHF